MKIPAEFDHSSRAWGQVKDILEEERIALVGKLCSLDCTPTTTEQLRGRIAFIRDFLASVEAAAKERLRTGV